MSIDLFRVQHGLDIENDITGKNANILVGDGIPGGDGDVQDSAPIGSFFLRTNTETDGLQVYWKHSNLNNSSADWKQSADKDYVDAIAAGLSWREPVTVLDGTTYANSAAFPLTGVIDGVTLSAGDRVLFTDVTASTDENIFIWDGSAWTEDTNAESDGDAVLVQDGSSSEEQWVYDGTNWVQFGSSTGATELGFLRDYVGKTGPGAESPTYSSTDVITQADNLETAIGDLDDAFGTGEITNDGGNNALSDDMSWGGSGTLEVTDALNELNDAIGDRSYTSDNVVTDGEDVATSIDALDGAIGNIQNQSSVFTGSDVVATAGVTVDTIPLADATEAKWIIQVRENATPANRRATEVHALNDGNTLVDNTNYAVLKLGSAIAGLKISADVSGTDMRLRVTSTNNIDYVVRRMGYTAF